MAFELDKKKYVEKLYKPDKSTKGNVDLEISELIDTINNLDCYYTTSSCSGRILLIDVSNKQRKKNAEWLFLTHSLASTNEVQSKLFSYDPKEMREVWFVQEPLILHICAKDTESAQKLIDVALLCGMKRSGIFSIKKERVMIEIIGCDRMDVPVIYDGKIQVSDDYIKTLVDIANEKMKNTFKINEKFLNMIKEKIKLKKLISLV